MSHWTLQFTLIITVCCVLHRYGSQAIHWWKLYWSIHTLKAYNYTHTHTQQQHTHWKPPLTAPLIRTQSKGDLVSYTHKWSICRFTYRSVTPNLPQKVYCRLSSWVPSSYSPVFQLGPDYILSKLEWHKQFIEHSLNSFHWIAFTEQPSRQHSFIPAPDGNNTSSLRRPPEIWSLWSLPPSTWFCAEEWNSFRRDVCIGTARAVFSKGLHHVRLRCKERCR